MPWTLEELLHGLDGAQIIRRVEDGWEGFFAGRVSVRNVMNHGSELRVELCFPTSPSDIDDYIWRPERETGTTDKVRVMHGDQDVGARVVAVRRRGSDERWEDPGQEEYCLGLVMPLAPPSVSSAVPLRVEFRWPSGDDAAVIAEAIGVV